MDLSIIAAILEWLKQMAIQYQTHIGGLFGIILTVYALYQKYQTVIARIVLRIQKDTADGAFTNEEKEQCAVDIYFNEILPLLPIYLAFLKIIPRFIVEPIIRKIVRGLCKKAGELNKVTK